MLQARAVLELADALDAELEHRGGTGLLRDVELPLVDVLARWRASASRSTSTMLDRAGVATSPAR